MDGITSGVIRTSQQTRGGTSCGWKQKKKTERNDEEGARHADRRKEGKVFQECSMLLMSSTAV